MAVLNIDPISVSIAESSIIHLSSGIIFRAVRRSYSIASLSSSSPKTAPPSQGWRSRMVLEFLASTRVGETRVLEVTWSMSRYSNSALFPRHDNPCQAVLKVSLRCHHASISKGSIIGCPQHICYQPRSSYWFYSNQECSIVPREQWAIVQSAHASHPTKPGHTYISLHVMQQE